MGILFTEGMGNILTTLMGNVLTEIVGKVLDIYTWSPLSKEEIRAEEISFIPDALAKATANFASLVC